MGNFFYTKDGLRYNFADGYTDGTTNGYHYYIRDHQGNNRVVAKYDGTIEQTTHYYPYGGILSQSTNQGFQKFKYNGKEFDTMHGLNMYDYGARQQDPAVGMFTSMDPLCEKYYNISPYMYCAGNPIMYVDPDGRKIQIFGNAEERKAIFAILQQLTNDNLHMNKNGLVTVAKQATRISYPNGTDLVREAISNKNIMKIGDGNSGVTEYENKNQATNGEGTNVTITFNTKVEQELPSTNPHTGRSDDIKVPKYISLGHEMIHGIRGMNGEKEKYAPYKFTYINKDGATMETQAAIEELHTVGIGKYDTFRYSENKLRKEHKIWRRDSYR